MPKILPISIEQDKETNLRLEIKPKTNPNCHNTVLLHPMPKPSIEPTSAQQEIIHKQNNRTTKPQHIKTTVIMHIQTNPVQQEPKPKQIEPKFPYKHKH